MFPNNNEREIPYLSSVNNDLHIDVIPEELCCLNTIEKRLIALVEVFMTILILSGGHFAEKGLVLNLPSNVQSIANQLPPNVSDFNTVVVNYMHKCHTTSDHYKYYASPAKLKSALEWLTIHNPLYANLVIKHDLMYGKSSDFLEKSNASLEDMEFVH